MADLTGSRDEWADDSGYGLVMFVAFTGAALIVTGAVALLAVVGSWWMLGVAFAVHVLMTTVITLAVVRSFGRGTLEVATVASRAAR